MSKLGRMGQTHVSSQFLAGKCSFAEGCGKQIMKCDVHSENY